MAFDGTDKTTCPNYNSTTGELDMSYQTFMDPTTMSDEQYGNENFNKTCFNICETESGNPTYIMNGRCNTCLDEEGEQNNPMVGTRNYLINAGLYQMCNIEDDNESGYQEPDIVGIPTWFQTQQDANLLGLSVDRIDWSSANSDTDNRIRNYWMDADRGMTNREILRYIGNRTPGTMEYTLPEEYVRPQMLGTTDILSVDVYDFEKLRRDINEGRGSVVNCTEGENKPDWAICPNDKFGPDDIIPEEVEDFTRQMIDNMIRNQETDAMSSLTSFSDMLSGLQYDSAFESCVNDKLNTGDNDLEIQSRIAGYTSIREFTSLDINYLKKKLRKIITMKSRDVQECMNLLNLGKSICQSGVADKTLMIGSLIFSIVGNDKIDVMQADNDERYKINKLVDELGPLIPQAVKNIISISKEYEARVCNVPSNTTLLLERLYNDLYDKPTHVSLDFSPYLDFSSLIDMKDNVKFIKTIVVLVVFAFLFMHATNLVIAFLSRGSGKSD
tara:strand:+ start:1434 stop:2933 length:1500 start_codon:yes stop_codon:yes gene_type:complete